MQDQKEKILNFMKDKSYVPMKQKEIASVLMVPKEEQEELLTILNELEEEFLIRKNRKNKYMLMEGKYIKGKYIANEKGYGFVVPEDNTVKDIFIPKGKSINAFYHDVVLVELMGEREEGKRQEGQIVKVLEHERDALVGTFQKSQSFGFVVPDDRKFGNDIFISKTNSGKAKNNDKVVVKITKYPEKDKKAEGEIVEVIGNKNDPYVDILSIVKEYGLPYEFPEEVLEEARKSPDHIKEEEILNRVDLRNKMIFTIDGDDAKDLDDAIRVEKSPNGNYLLDVHIADVSHYVKESSLLDKEAVIRGTSVYMLGSVIPMLPKELSNGICSLNEGQDRLALSVTIEIDPKGNVVSSNVYKSVIKVTKRMTYEKVQQTLDGIETDTYTQFKNELDRMQELALILKQKRHDKGYLNLDIPETKITLDENGQVTDVQKYEMYFSNEIIEQFMLTANEAIAEKFFWLEAPFIYRVHEVPDIEKINELNKFLFNFGYKIKVVNDIVYPKEFSKILEEIEGKEEQTVIANLILRTLKVARYEAENKGHFGIASSYYCHFTSPIRRYPDLFIHRMISKYLENNYNVEEDYLNLHKGLAIKYAGQSSETENTATKAERTSVDMKKAEYMEQRIGEEMIGIISNITSFGVFVELENTIEGLIRFDDLGDEYFVYDETKKTLMGERTNTRYKIGDKMTIRVIAASKELRQIDFEKV